MLYRIAFFTERGSFSLGIEKLSGDIVTASTTFSAIPTSASTTATLDLPANADIAAATTSATLKLDFNSDGIVDVTLVSKPNQEVIYDVTPPEIEISFDQETKALKVRGFDTVSSTTVMTSATSSLVTDQAGNTTELTFSTYRIKPKKIELIISSIKQNGVVVSTSSIPLTYKWNTISSTSTTFKTLASYIKTPDRSVETHYRPKQGQTVIMTTPLNLSDADDGDEVDNRPTKEKLSGIHMVKLMTERGRMNISY